MKQTIIPIKADAKLILRTSADLFIEGSDQAQLVATVDDGDSFRMRDENGAIYVQANTDVKLTLPATVKLVLERVSGDVSIIGIKELIEIQKVGGDLQFQQVGSLTADTIGGGCVFKEVNGSVEVKRVGGDFDGFKAGDVIAHSLGGDVQLSSINGKVELTAGGDVLLQLSSAIPQPVQVRAGGDISLGVMEATNAQLKLNSNDEKISVHASGQMVDVNQEEYELPLGTGGATIELNAGGEIRVREGKEAMGEFSFVFSDFGESWRDFGREIEEKVRQSMRGVNHQLRHAGWEASRAMRHAADHFDNFVVGGRPDGKVYGFGFDQEQTGAPTKEKKAVSDEERMLVLRMLQEKKISVEEAEKLLQALEG